MKLPLYRQIYQQIINDIRDGNLRAGDRVPSENALAERFNVSRITSKKALEELAKDGIVDRIQGQGSFVQNPLPDITALAHDQASSSPKNDSKQSDSPTLGFILPDFGDVYGTRLFRAIEQRCAALGYQLMVRLTYGHQETETQSIQAMIDACVSGLIVFPAAGEFFNPVLLRLALDGFPLVVVDRYFKDIPANSVHTDNVKATYMLTNYLLDEGHTQIAFLSPPAKNTSTIEDRIQGFVQAFSHQGLSLDPVYCFDKMMSTLPNSFGHENIEADKQRLRSFLKEYPSISAIVASEYNVAMIARQTIQALNRAIPQDIAIVCFDSPQNPLEEPVFTHIQQDETAMGTVAVNMLNALIRKESVERKTVIDFKLVKGTST